MIAALLTALVLVPSLSVSGKTLHWTPAGSGSYRVQENVDGQRLGSVRVDGTSYEPEAQPGRTVSYRVRSTNGEWSNSVTISFPARGKGTKGEEPPAEEPPAEEPPAEEAPRERPKKERPPKEPPLEE